MTRLKVAIVGCGVAGSVLAYSLSRMQGVEVVCYEKASLEDHSEAGTGLNVGPNAIKVLQHASDVTQNIGAQAETSLTLRPGTSLTPRSNVVDDRFSGG